MLLDKQSELMSDLLFTVHQHGGDDVTWKPPIRGFPESRTFDVRKRVNKIEAMYWVELRVAFKRSSWTLLNFYISLFQAFR